jgi:hypothetical protein
MFDKKNAMIFNSASDTVLLYNETGKMIFELIQKGYDKNRIIHELQSIYDVDQETLKRDLDEFLSEQKQKEVIL